MTHTTATPRRTDVTLTVLRVGAALSVLVLLWQFVTAGEFLGPRGDDGFEPLHAAGAIVLHVVSALALVGAALHRRRAGRAVPWWPTALAAVVFVLTFVQAWFGSGATLYVHVPGAMVLSLGAVWLAAWSFAPERARA